MNFFSQDFLIFFSIITVIWYLTKEEMVWFVGAAGSLYFYYTWSPWFPLLILVPSISVFLLTKDGFEFRKNRKFMFFCSLATGSLLLLFYKFSGIIYDTLKLMKLEEQEGLERSPLYFLLPVGLSFFTFRLISYSVDVYNKVVAPEKHFGNFLFYVSFFPQLLAGPIERAKDFLPQIKERISFDLDRIISGLQLFFWGVFKKLAVSERLLPFVDDCFKNPDGKGLSLLFAAWFYSFVIYCDFSGYTDMAIGLARILGIRSAENFNYPYLSRSITEFWNRWHISLSTWLRDYLFLHISYKIMGKVEGNSLWGIKTEKWGYVGGMLITMLLGGFWHGDKWTFIVWGLLHGLYLALSFLTKKKRKKFVKKTGLSRYPRLHRAINIFTTFNIVTMAWVFFYADTVSEALMFLNKMGLKMNRSSVGHIVFNSLIIFMFLGMEYFYKNRKSILSRFKEPQFVKVSVFAFFICLLLSLAVDKGNFFIYMRF